MWKQSKLSSVPLFSPSQTMIILFYLAAHFTFFGRLQKVLNSAAKLLLKARKLDHVQPLLQAIHWLPVQARIDYKLSTICHNFFSDRWLPISLTLSLCTPLPGSLVLLHTHTDNSYLPCYSKNLCQTLTRHRALQDQQKFIH